MGFNFSPSSVTCSLCVLPVPHPRYPLWYIPHRRHCLIHVFLVGLIRVRYDYLVFSDSQGKETKYDGKVGMDRWPLRDDFKGSEVDFTFFSDGSNNAWGYKFAVSYGCGY